MKYLEQKPGLFWWTKNVRYLMYFLRELNGILLGLTVFVLILFFYAAILFHLYLNLDRLTTAIIWICLISSLIHTITWLGAMPKILPLQLSAFRQKIAYVILVIFWLGLSYLLLKTLYMPYGPQG